MLADSWPRRRREVMSTTAAGLITKRQAMSLGHLQEIKEILAKIGGTDLDGAFALSAALTPASADSLRAVKEILARIEALDFDGAYALSAIFAQLRNADAGIRKRMSEEAIALCWFVFLLDDALYHAPRSLAFRRMGRACKRSRSRCRKPDEQRIREVQDYKKSHTWAETDRHFHYAPGGAKLLILRAKKRGRHI